MQQFTLIVFFLCTISTTINAQTLKGKVVDKFGTPLIGVNIYLLTTPAIGTTTDAAGDFELEIETVPKGNLIISYTGYEKQVHAIPNLLAQEQLRFTLLESKASLESVTIKAAPAIAEEFSVTKIDRLDIYKNPIAAADPLRALTVLPASTNTDESANPNLRGSSSVRSRVILNGVPVFKPVRNSQINGLGNFSLFNTEIIGSQTVYAGNPPLTYGNATAGLVDIQTRNTLENNNTQIALSLANIGTMLSRKLSQQTFLQVYGNLQFASPFLALNRSSLDFLNNFSTIDAGVNFHTKWNTHWTLNYYGYGILEDYGATIQQLNFEANATVAKQRNFNVLNIAYQKGKHLLTFNQGIDFSASDYGFGNLQSEEQEQTAYSSLNYKYYFSDDFSIKTGLTYQYFNIQLEGQTPRYFYAVEAQHPVDLINTTLTLHDLQYYSYAKWQAAEKLLFGAGLRGNLTNTASNPFLSLQASIRWQFTEQQRLLLAGGQYHNYNIPNFLNQNYNLLSSQQLALEYTYSREDFELNAAIYQKTEAGDVLNYNRQRTNARNIMGAEMGITYRANAFWSFQLANSFLNATFKTEGQTYKSANDMNYFLKLGIQYDRLSVASFSLFYMQRPGTHYTSITGGLFNSTVQAYQPIFSNVWNDSQFSSYHSLNLALSKYFSLNQWDVIAFFNINNLLNTTNERSPLYDTDFSTLSFDHFSKRILYFGMVVSW